MANAKISEKEALRQENVEQTVSRTEQFYNTYKKCIWGTVIVIIVIFLAALGFNKFIYQPKCQEAAQMMFPAEEQFANGEWELALNGDGNTYGFAQIIDEYGSKAGKAVYFYAGVCALQTGAYEDALEYLGKYNGKEIILAARAKACEGDAYVGLEQYDKAVKAFKQAASMSDNTFSAAYLLKAGVACEKLGQKSEALECYETIKNDYPNSLEAYEIDKFIAGVEE